MIARDLCRWFIETESPGPAMRDDRIRLSEAKEAYRAFCETEPSVPIFSRAWWLDATAGPGNWQVALVTRNGKITAAMPYMIQRRYGLKVLGQPVLTPRLGPWFRPGEGKPATRLAMEKEAMQALIDQLPPFDHFTQNWHYDCMNWLPFSWNGFQQTTRYTYVLPSLDSVERLWSGLQHTTRAECKKASHRFGMQVIDTLPLDTFLALNRMTFARQGMAVPYSDAFVRRFDAACAERGCRTVLIAVDRHGRPAAGLYMVWDENSAYGLMAGADPEMRHSGAASLCFWEAIQRSSRLTRRFDFSGSMMQPVERFFRGFGASLMPYSCISKSPSRLMRLRQSMLFAFKDQ